MIEREFIREKVKYMKVKEYVRAQIPKSAGIGFIMIEKTPLGEKITISAVKPGLIIGRGGRTIADLTTTLKVKFKMENPQIEVHEIESPHLSASVVANKIAGDMEKFGPSRFKAIGYRALQDIMSAGALGAEIRIAGRGVPGSRAQAWRFPAGYMKKCGKLAMEDVDIAITPANLHSGTVGIQVMIMPPTIQLPDRIKIREIKTETPVEKAEAKAEAAQEAVQKAETPVTAAAASEVAAAKPRAARKKSSTKQAAEDKSKPEQSEKLEEIKDANTPGK